MKTSKSQFDVEHLKTDLMERSVRSGAVTISGQGASFILRTISTVVLARLLAPNDFGLIAMVTVVTGFAALFKDLGLSMATIQKAEINHEQITNLFWVNMVASVMLTMVTAASAPIIVWFYGEPRLLLITLAISVVFIFGGLTVQHLALLERQMRFTAIAVNEIIALCISSGVAIVSSLFGAGYWALVLMQVISALSSVIGVWWICDWRPGSPFIRADVKGMLTFGMNLTGSNILNYFIKNFDNILIGKTWGANQLGLYSKAYGLLLFPINQINVPIATVAIPALSRLQNNPDEYAKYYYRALSVIAFIALPAIMTLAALSHEVITFVLGDQWSKAAPIFNVLAFAALAQTIVDPVGWVYVSLAQTKRMMQWGLISAPIVVTAFVIGLPWGAYGVAVSYTICSITLLLFPSLWWAFRYSPLTISGWLMSIRSSFICSLIIYIVIQLARFYFTFGNRIINLMVYGGIAFITFIIFIASWPEAREQARSVFGLVKLILRNKTCGIDSKELGSAEKSRLRSSQLCNNTQQYKVLLEKLPAKIHIKEMPKVSIIIPTYNRVQYINLAIDSVLRQTYQNYEIIVVDDGSSDSTKENLKRYGDKIIYIYQNNSGVSAARNTGIENSCGTWLAFLDSDDEWETDYLSQQIDRANNIPGLSMQMTNSRIIGLDGQITNYFTLNKSMRKFKDKDYLFIEQPFRFTVVHKPWQIGSTIILREAITKAGPFNTGYNISEDYDLIVRVANTGAVGLIREELVNVYRRDESIRCLTGEAICNPLMARTTDEKIFESLKMIRPLKYGERISLNKALSKNRRAIGNILLKNGNIQEARYSYKRSLFLHPSIYALAKYIFSLVLVK